jgi:hypothetical protein
MVGSKISHNTGLPPSLPSTAGFHGKEEARKTRPRKEHEARVPEHLPAVDEVIEPAEVAAAPEA